MSDDQIRVNEKVIIYQNNGLIIGGCVIERTSTSLRLLDAFRVVEEAVFSPEPIWARAEDLGNIEIPLASISRWRELPVGV